MILQSTSLRGRSGVRFPLQPHENESLPGYLARVAAWNVLEGPKALLRMAGVAGNSELADQVAARALEFTRELGISQASLLRMVVVGDAPGSAEVSFFGAPLRRNMVRTKVRHVAPASLRISNHHRATWQVSAISWCPETWDPLIDKCPACGQKLNFETQLGVEYCQACSFNLGLAEVVPIPSEYRPHLKVLSDSVSPSAHVRSEAANSLPKPFRELSSNALLGLAATTARALRSRPNATLAPSELAAAVEMLAAYPASFEATVERHADRSTPAPFFQRLNASPCLASYPELERIAPEILARFLPPSRLRKTVIRQREELGLLTARAAATRLGLTRSQLYQLLQAGELHLRYGWYQPEQIEAVAARLANRVSLARLEKHFGLPRSGAEQLISLGLLKINTDPLIAKLFAGLQIDRRSWDDLMAKLEAAIGLPSIPEPPITLLDAFHAVGGQEKPWGAIIGAHVTRKVVGALTHEPTGQLRFSSLSVTPKFARELASGARPDLMEIPPRAKELGPPPGFSRTEVERYLNCFPRDVAWLIEAGSLAPYGAARLLFPRDQVIALGETVISSREISWRWRVSPDLRERLHREGIVKRCLGPFWPRAEMTAYFGRLLPKGAPI